MSMKWERADGAPPNPLAWSVPLGTLTAVPLRLHFSFLVYAVLVLLRAAGGTATGAALHGVGTVAMALGALLLVIALREWVRAMVVRASGGSVDEVMLWPLGSVQGIEPAPGWLAALAAAAVGPAVSLVQLAIGGVVLGVSTGDWSTAVPDPMTAEWLATPHAWWVEALWILQWTGVQVLLLSLLPMVPLDGGRAAEAIIMRRRGAFEAPRAATVFSLAAAAAVGMVAVVRDLPVVLTVAIACAGYAVFLLWRMRAGDAVARADADARGAWLDGDRGAPSEPDPEREEREAAARRREARAAEDRELDRILARIAAEGADALSPAERVFLDRVSARRRRESGGPGNR
ncbi:MAG: hypothetical protein RI990_535 [Planctomycetota bacterium]|jgi:Zn-dependent protease